MRILFVTTDLASGGAQRVVSILANRFSLGHAVAVVTVQGDKVKYELDKRVKYIPILVKHSDKIGRVFERIVLIRKAFKEYKPDVIISFETENNIYSIFCKAFLNLKLIVSERNDPNRDPDSSIVRKLRDLVYPFADGLVFQTKDAQAYFSCKIQNKSVVIPNPVNNTFVRERYPGERKKDIVNVSRLYPQKNLEMFIDIISKVTEKYPEYRGVIYGDGPEKERLLVYAASKAIADNIVFAGFTDNVATAIQDSSIYLCTSDYEGISNSVLEAMTLGLPVVATDCPIGGTRMMIEDGKNGYLYPIGETDIAVERIIKLIENDDIANKLGSKAQEIKNKWSQECITARWQEYIESLTKMR